MGRGVRVFGGCVSSQQPIQQRLILLTSSGLVRNHRINFSKLFVAYRRLIAIAPPFRKSSGSKLFPLLSVSMKWRAELQVYSPFHRVIQEHRIVEWLWPNFPGFQCPVPNRIQRLRLRSVSQRLDWLESHLQWEFLCSLERLSGFAEAYLR